MDVQQRASMGARIREARKERRLSMEEAAEAAGLTRNTWSRIESGGQTHPGSLRAAMASLGIEPGGAPPSWPEDVELVRDLVAEWLLAAPEDVRKERRDAIVRLIAGFAKP